MNEVTLILSLLSIILTSITAIFSFMAYCKVIGMEKSTHQVAYMPVPTPQEQEQMEKNPTGENLAKEMGDKMYPDMEDEFV